MDALGLCHQHNGQVSHVIPNIRLPSDTNSEGVAIEGRCRGMAAVVALRSTSGLFSPATAPLAHCTATEAFTRNVSLHG